MNVCTNFLSATKTMVWTEHIIGKQFDEVITHSSWHSEVSAKL